MRKEWKLIRNVRNNYDIPGALFTRVDVKMCGQGAKYNRTP